MLERRVPRPPKTTLKGIRTLYGVKQQTVARLLGITTETIRVKEYTPVRGMKVDSVERYVRAMGGRLELWVVMPDGSGLQLEVDSQG